MTLWRSPRSSSGGVDETYVKVRGKRAYLYRALDQGGNTIDGQGVTFIAERRRMSMLSCSPNGSPESDDSSSRTAWVKRSSKVCETISSSHKKGILPRADTFGENNMLSRDQEITVDLDERRAVDMVLRPGEMSLHHTWTAHGSRPNLSDRARMGFVITYMAPATARAGASPSLERISRTQRKVVEWSTAKPRSVIIASTSR